MMATTSQTMPPPAPPIPFAQPVLYPARRVTGLVTFLETSSGSQDQLGRMAQSSWSHDDAARIPPTLRRTSSMSGNILIVKLPEGERAYWLQRIMCETAHGAVRVAFWLQKPSRESSMEWTVQPSPDGPYPFEMVAIKIQDMTSVGNTLSGRDPMVEVAALQAIAAQDGADHVLGTREACTDGNKVYIIMPYHGEGSLFQYVVECGRLSEGVARHFFRQIISGLSSMQEAGLCHRDLSLQNVLLRGTNCRIVGLGLSLRVPLSVDAQRPILLEPQASCGSNLLYLAPEILQNVPFDGFAVDLWAAGVMLCVMLFGTSAPFVWASPEDKRYREVCIKGNLTDIAIRRWEGEGNTSASNEALDLIQNMLRAEPTDRLTLKGIREHPWFLADATAPNLPLALRNLR